MYWSIAKKVCLVLAEGERAIVITANYHLNTRGIPIRQHF